jgi:translation initiation factor IF-1
MTKSNELIDYEGEIVEVLPNQTFKIKLDNDHQIIAYTGGRMRQNKIRLVQGDRVRVEMTPYDMSKGRIIHRL